MNIVRNNWWIIITNFIQLRFCCFKCENIDKETREQLQVHLLPIPNQLNLTEEYILLPNIVKVEIYGIESSNNALIQFGLELREDFNINVEWVEKYDKIELEKDYFKKNLSPTNLTKKKKDICCESALIL